ncbi:PREDICTED: probable RNA methyltransferase Y17G7B.18, partial [Priapulus caudatus]|uniref:RNA methyltransferase n=1 Tax=Priapulus caudatus TaxID=37621 RepID=A0ABM1DX05_PRICU
MDTLSSHDLCSDAHVPHRKHKKKKKKQKRNHNVNVEVSYEISDNPSTTSKTTNEYVKKKRGDDSSVTPPVSNSKTKKHKKHKRNTKIGGCEGPKHKRKKLNESRNDSECEADHKNNESIPVQQTKESVIESDSVVATGISFSSKKKKSSKRKQNKRDPKLSDDEKNCDINVDSSNVNGSSSTVESRRLVEATKTPNASSTSREGDAELETTPPKSTTRAVEIHCTPTATPDAARPIPTSHNPNVSGTTRPPAAHTQREVFPYGNYVRYYGYRNPDNADHRFDVLRHEWFRDKDVLDIGCNTGHLTLLVAKEMKPRKIIGIDIDGQLIKIAQKNVRHYLPSSRKGSTFPVSFPMSYGLVGNVSAQPGSVTEFPNNVLFVKGNYVLDSDVLLEMQKPQFDTVLFLSTSKWIQLNWGDSGLKRTFRRMLAQLRPGGHLIMEAQPWNSYHKSKKINETIAKNYHGITLKPEEFPEYLLSSEVGFASCEHLDTPYNQSKGFQRAALPTNKSEDP